MRMAWLALLLLLPATPVAGEGLMPEVWLEADFETDRKLVVELRVATGGGLVFGGDANGRFKAFDDRTGEVLWEINLGSSVSGYPITYAVDGRQYVAVNTGSGSINLTPELRPSRGTSLFVFALPSRE